MEKVTDIKVRLGIPDYIYPKEQFDKQDMSDLPDGAYLIGFEDEDGNECDEEGNYLS